MLDINGNPACVIRFARFCGMDRPEHSGWNFVLGLSWTGESEALTVATTSY